MSAFRITSGRAILPALILSFVLANSATAWGQQPAPKPADAAAINQAIQNGVLYLQSVQDPRTGGWGTGTGPGSDKGWAIGFTALAGIALVECGVPNTDRGLKTAADSIRLYVDRGDIDSTYEVSLAILFLERMGNKSDNKRIQSLAGRLIAGQTPTGGWGYKVPKISAADQELLMNALRKMSPPQPQPAPSMRERPPSLGLCIKVSDDILEKPPPAFDGEKARTAVVAALPANMKRWSVFQGSNVTVLGDPKDKASEPFNATTDNSNTHFATLAMWAARKHNVPVERSLTLLAQRFRTSQGADGTWGYPYARNGGGGSPAMTCVALLGLAIGHVVDPDVAVRPEQDPRVVNAFVWLSGRVGAPVGTTLNRPTPKEAGGLYFMWSMERIAVLYDVGKLDKKDWYQWGAEILLGNQQADGKWENGGDIEQLKHPVISTSMALLFLRRANLTPDLSRRLTVDTSALTQKVTDTVSPQPPTPTPKPPEIAPIALAPLPREVIEVRPTPPAPTPQPVVTTPVSELPAPVHEKKSSLIWIVLIAVLVAVLGACLFFYIRMKRNAEEEEKPRKKKRKVKAKVEE